MKKVAETFKHEANMAHKRMKAHNEIFFFFFSKLRPLLMRTLWKLLIFIIIMKAITFSYWESISRSCMCTTRLKTGVLVVPIRHLDLTVKDKSLFKTLRIKIL